MVNINEAVLTFTQTKNTRHSLFSCGLSSSYHKHEMHVMQYESFANTSCTCCCLIKLVFPGQASVSGFLRVETLSSFVNTKVRKTMS